ncbi:hypothetical protein [Henriciella sp.]|uniref:hypothetical protein n=1 Tax=Henriciella sp. TaxID=1968823 RepID=UPI0025C35FBB|nr:hypothetical protein [Henriciella sp.]
MVGFGDLAVKSFVFGALYSLPGFQLGTLLCLFLADVLYLVLSRLLGGLAGCGAL